MNYSFIALGKMFLNDDKEIIIFSIFHSKFLAILLSFMSYILRRLYYIELLYYVVLYDIVLYRVVGN